MTPVHYLFLTGVLTHISRLLSSQSALKSRFSTLTRFRASEHQPMQQSIEPHQTVFLNIWCGIFFPPCPKSLLNPEGEVNIVVFNPLYLWGLCSI